MKHNLFLALVFSLMACEYHDIQPDSPMDALQGKWTVQKDSINFGGSPHLYSRSEADYYDFRSDGSLIISESGVLDTATYSISSGRKVSISFNDAKLINVMLNASAVASFSIQGHLGGEFAISDLSKSSIKMADSFSYTIDPVVTNQSGPIAPVKVSSTVWLKR